MDHYDKIVNILDRPYFKNLETMGISDIHYEEIFKRLYNETVIIYDREILLKENRKTLYYESNIGDWYRKIYDIKNNKVHYEDSDDHWYKYEYDNNGNEIYREDYRGDWYKYVYDENGKRLYYEDSNGITIS